MVLNFCVAASDAFVVVQDYSCCYSRGRPAAAVVAKPSARMIRLNDKSSNFIGDLWNELIEFSTLGPGERKRLQERRRTIAASSDNANEGDIFSVAAFQTASVAAAQRKNNVGDDDDDDDSSTTAAVSKRAFYNDNDNSVSLEAFQAAKVAINREAASPLACDDFDGYALRDLLVCKWGAPLDVGFSRGGVTAASSVVYCSVLPVAFGSRKCQHETELDYLMHLQGVVEVLRTYENLARFVDYVQTTDKTPKPGTDSVPFRLHLTATQLERIL